MYRIFESKSGRGGWVESDLYVPFRRLAAAIRQAEILVTFRRVEKRKRSSESVVEVRDDAGAVVWSREV